ncbi:MAG: dTDP-4-dehydrorhamnose reductase [bacterium]|nr:dTDP-4-dehydrorhamnose reductase [bacterium]
MSQIGWQRVERERRTPTRVLVLGSSGMVGRAWCKLLERRGIDYTPLQRPEFDLSDTGSIDRAVTDGYGLVVNAAAWTDVDGAEAQEAHATQANAHAVHQIAERCNAAGSMLINYSTDYVFNGKAETPYPVDHAPEPINAYGRSKALGESLLRGCTQQHILIRTSWVHAPWGKNFVRTMRSLMSEREELRVVDDQRGRPTSALSIAEGSMKLFEKGALGTWHLTDAGECTWFGLASRIRHELGSSCDLQPCASDAFPRPAARPAYSTLDITATDRLIGPLPDWESTVAASIA